MIIYSNAPIWNIMTDMDAKINGSICVRKLHPKVQNSFGIDSHFFFQNMTEKNEVHPSKGHRMAKYRMKNLIWIAKIQHFMMMRNILIEGIRESLRQFHSKQSSMSSLNFSSFVWFRISFQRSVTVCEPRNRSFKLPTDLWFQVNVKTLLHQTFEQRRLQRLDDGEYEG